MDGCGVERRVDPGTYRSLVVCYQSFRVSRSVAWRTSELPPEKVIPMQLSLLLVTFRSPSPAL